MNINTGREFSWTNPQDDRELYPRPPPGFYYDLSGRLAAKPCYTSSPLDTFTTQVKDFNTNNDPNAKKP